MIAERRAYALRFMLSDKRNISVWLRIWMMIDGKRDGKDRKNREKLCFARRLRIDLLS